MEPNEIDIALEELEQRLERLRSLYEQYFLGIEKIEPTIARKDVDRRFWILRRTKLRNTARRFRMQLLVQRYNTFQQYWMRICRQIENGTYTRHVLRAEKKFGKEAVTIKARRREDANAKARGLVAAERARKSGALEAVADGNEAPPSTAGAPASDPPPSDGFSTKRTVAFPAVTASATRSADEATPVEPRPLRPKRIPREEPEDAEIEIHDPSRIRREDPDDAEIEIHNTPVPYAVSFYNKPTTKLPAIPAAGRGENIGKHLPPAPASTRFSHRPMESMTPAPRSAVASSKSGATSPSAVSEQRVQELHAQLSAEKKRLADGSAVSVDNLAKSLNETAAKLKAMHGSNKQVDFRVVVKGGKAMVKPVLK